MADKFPDHAADLANDFSQSIQWATFYLAIGIALAWLGWKAIKEISRYESGNTGVTATPGKAGEASRKTPPIR
jgi:hypothetical protein